VTMLLAQIALHTRCFAESRQSGSDVANDG